MLPIDIDALTIQSRRISGQGRRASTDWPVRASHPPSMPRAIASDQRQSIAATAGKASDQAYGLIAASVTVAPP